MRMGPPQTIINAVTVNTNGGQVTSSAVLGCRGASALLLRMWDNVVGGTPKTISAFNPSVRCVIAGVASTLQESTLSTHEYNLTTTAAQGVSWRPAASGPVLVWVVPTFRATTFGMQAVFGFDEFAVRLVSDATTNPMVVMMDAQLVWQAGAAVG